MELLKTTKSSWGIESPFLDFQFNPEEAVKEYVNRIASTIVENVELHLGIHNLHVRFHPKKHVHPNLQAL